MRFLFWNIKKNPAVNEILRELARHHGIDLLAIAECPHEGQLLAAVNDVSEPLFHLTDSKRTRVSIYTAFPSEYLASEYHDNTLTIRRLALPGKVEIVFAAAHLPSKIYRSTGADRHLIAERVSEEIRRVEGRLGHSRTLLVGDMNMDPFEEPVVSAAGLHSAMTKSIARKGSREVFGKAYPFFYNPMWGRFGDTTRGPAGTYYWTGRSRSVEYFWHTFDQVLVRPELLDSFQTESLRILEGCGNMSFLRETGIPDAGRVSDHLPMMFDLDI
jgi:hypothetical protein